MRANEHDLNSLRGMIRRLAMFFALCDNHGNRKTKSTDHGVRR